jgi:hypothetical protein
MLMSAATRGASDRYWCECGQPKAPSARACSRCRYLDGSKRTVALVIATLRTVGGLSLTELCEAVYGPVTERRAYGTTGSFSVIRGGCRNPARVMLVLTSRLVAQGCLRRYWREGDSCEQPNNLPGLFGRVTKTGGSGHWVYVLDARIANALSAASLEV